jgi:hypothetical protein
MNHRIRMKKPDGPVIVCQEDDMLTEANLFEISVGGMIVGHVVFEPEGLGECETHDVKAWVEFNNQVQVRGCGKLIVSPRKAKPVAEAKLPNKRIKTK